MQLPFDGVKASILRKGSFGDNLESAFFGAQLRLRTFLYFGGYMSKELRQQDIDITGVVLTPGAPTVCLGNGKQGFACCCDECDHFLLCYPEFDPESKKEAAMLGEAPEK